MTSFANRIKVSALLACLIALPAVAEEAIATGGNSSVNYSHTVLTRISDHAIYPRSAEARAEEGVVTLALTVDHTGNVADLKVLASSGVPAIDRAALQAALAAAPYPTPAADKAEVKGRVRFEM